MVQAVGLIAVNVLVFAHVVQVPEGIVWADAFIDTLVAAIEVVPLDTAEVAESCILHEDKPCVSVHENVDKDPVVDWAVKLALIVPAFQAVPYVQAVLVTQVILKLTLPPTGAAFACPKRMREAISANDKAQILNTFFICVSKYNIKSLIWKYHIMGVLDYII